MEFSRVTMLNDFQIYLLHASLILTDNFCHKQKGKNMAQKKFLIYTKNSNGEWNLHGVGSSMRYAAEVLSEKKVIKVKVQHL
jgi:hypothetical protein